MLTCMVTYRCTDKKPCDNILKEPITKPLVNNSLSNIIGGKKITNKLVTKIDLLNDPIGASTASLASADSLVCKDFGGTLTKLADNILTKSLHTSALSASIGDPIGKGNFLPLCQVTDSENAAYSVKVNFLFPFSTRLNFARLIRAFSLMYACEIPLSPR